MNYLTLQNNINCSSSATEVVHVQVLQDVVWDEAEYTWKHLGWEKTNENGNNIIFWPAPKIERLIHK